MGLFGVTLADAAQPVSTDIRAVEESTTTPMDLLPDAGALSMTTTVLREWMGQMVYQWRGWN